MMCQFGFISCNKCPYSGGDVDNEGGCVCVGTENIWEISVPSPQFCCEPKTALKELSLINKKGKERKRGRNGQTENSNFSIPSLKAVKTFLNIHVIL